MIIKFRHIYQYDKYINCFCMHIVKCRYVYILCMFRVHALFAYAALVIVCKYLTSDLLGNRTQQQQAVYTILVKCESTSSSSSVSFAHPTKSMKNCFFAFQSFCP